MSGELVLEKRGGLYIRRHPERWQCPYCLRDVGLLGRALAVLVGVKGAHGCDFRNVMHPQEVFYLRADADRKGEA